MKLRCAFGWGTGLGGLRRPSLAWSFCLASFVRQLFERGLRLSLLLHHHLGRPNRLESLLPTRQFSGQFIAPPIGAIGGIILSIGGFRLRQQPFDFRRELRLFGHHPPVAHRLVLRRIRRDLGAIQGDVPQLHQARLLAELQHLHK